ncbi:hypothetical protein Egran_01471 [Elaphomyces granulatus]|uniref:Copper acquisition factor BIM1-like domain-containing protein n=1 Tax=Elaphomyces granulatus TaxID=519963 RepID=A0A232M346_9EURO|nr:hypothetical protein Egran_01471 [Elaphomyces granulatus]
MSLSLSSVTAVAFLALAMISPSAAHFLLNYPPTIGFDDSLESTPPCGSFTVMFSTDNVTDFHVTGNAIAVTSIHPQATWLFRATLDLNATTNWTSLLPAIQQTGLGDYCEPEVTVPSSWAGQKGVIGVVQDSPDGILFQCAAVNFVVGNQAPPDICKNATGLSATYTADMALSTLPATPAATASGSGTSTAVSSTKSEAFSLKTAYPYSLVSSVVWAGTVVFFLA